MTSYYANLEKLWSQADQLDISDGLKAYIRYHDMFFAMAHRYGTTIEVAVGVFSALSPNNDYLNNLRGAATLLHWARHGVTNLNNVNVGTFHHARARAIRLINGEPFFEVSKGLKTRNFYLNIVDPTDPIPVTIDGHMYWAAHGKDGTMTEVRLGRPEYREIAGNIRELAKRQGFLPCQMQAILWFTRKRIKQVVYDRQLDFMSADQGFQKTVFGIDEIKLIDQPQLEVVA